ncbi:MAG TPA: hypothetical protein VM324_10760 [Egibacteraceae bacterium]|nr:hypothetical protein [Egibacteraceae bacterium]
MQSEPSVSASLFIPDDITAVFADDARVQVRSTRPPAPGPVGRRPASSTTGLNAALQRTSRQQQLVIMTAVWIALVGLGLCTAWWTNLSMNSASAAWTALSWGGGAIWVLGTAVALSVRFGPVEDHAPDRAQR